MKVTSCNRCHHYWKRRASRLCCWDHPVPDTATSPLPHWLTAGETQPWRSWRPRWLEGCAPSTSPLECERQTPAVRRRHERKDRAFVATIGSTVYARLLPVSDHEARTHGSECRKIQCFIRSARAAVSKLENPERFSANASDEHSIIEQCCPLADKVARTSPEMRNKWTSWRR